MVTQRWRAVKWPGMFGVRSAPALPRSAWALLFAVALALRLVTPAGFMPAFDRGAVSVIVCPDDGPAGQTIAHHHHGGGQKIVHQHCPYAAGASGGFLTGEVAAIALIALFGSAVLLGRAFSFLERRRPRERPPLRGPPLLL